MVFTCDVGVLESEVGGFARVTLQVEETGSLVAGDAGVGGWLAGHGGSTAQGQDGEGAGRGVDGAKGAVGGAQQHCAHVVGGIER